ncbi:MAG: FAD-dependent oxidoreductase [Planctomycetales bacterium]|nr:FAD-dependent oxidoreductase [Planctomycetales bacterium]
MSQYSQVSRRVFLKAAAYSGVAATVAPYRRRSGAEDDPSLSCDTFVYGSTPGGIAAAVEAARQGERVILACPKANLGGMSASGLCTTDAVRRNLFGGLVLEFIQGVRERYRDALGGNEKQLALTRDGWHYEPSIAEAVFRDLIEKEERITWIPSVWLQECALAGRHIRSVSLEPVDAANAHPSVTITARTFIDGTYEGDLAAKAGVDYRVGREARDEFGETKAGIHYMNWRTGQQIMTPDTGEPSEAIQAFCARSIFTNDPRHLIPIEKPDSYELHLQDLLPLAEDFRSGRLRGWGRGTELPGSKYQMNGSITGLTSTNCPGVNWGYPEAGRAHRRRLDEFHRDHAASLIWFLQHDSAVPDDVRTYMQGIGLHDEEFVDNGHWPWQLYVRQGRRIVGRAILTQRSFTPDPATGMTPRVDGAIAMGEHSFDVHPCHDRRFQVDGFMEGVLWYPQKADGPAQPGQIPYDAMLPKTLDNLIVPVAMSSTHVAMSVLRMEPVWMTTGQVAGLAAATARQQSLDAAEIDPNPLPLKLGIQTQP